MNEIRFGIKSFNTLVPKSVSFSAAGISDDQWRQLADVMSSIVAESECSGWQPDEPNPRDVEHVLEEGREFFESCLQCGCEYCLNVAAYLLDDFEEAAARDLVSTSTAVYETLRTKLDSATPVKRTCLNYSASETDWADDAETFG